MPIVYEVPTHLNVNDTILFGLSTHQLVRLAAAGSLAYGVWDQANVLPPELRFLVAGLLAATGLACGLLQPGGRPLDRWALAALLYLLTPRRLAWRRVELPARGAALDGSGWAELWPEVTWAEGSITSDEPLETERLP